MFDGRILASSPSGAARLTARVGAKWNRVGEVKLKQKGKLEMRSVGRFGLLTFGLAIALAVAIAWYFSLDAVLSWLIAITLVTFLTYGYDKAVAGSDRTRVPEKVLLALTFAGGTIGAIVARPVFHHKTAKASFRVKFSLVVGLQVILGLVYFIWVESKL